MPFRLLAAILALSAAALSIAWPDSSRVPPDRPGLPRIDSVAVPVPGPADSPDWLAAVALSQEHFYGEVQAEIDAYLAALEAQRLADEAAARARVRPVAAPQIVSGDCAAVAEVVGWGTVSRESGGNPGATNGIYLGCAQIGTPWWNGPCAGLDWTNVADQAACARIVLAAQGPSAWAQTWG